MKTIPPILVAGSNGYIGRRLLQAFEERGAPARRLDESPPADALSLRRALSGIHTTFFLMENPDPRWAKKFAHACAVNKVQKIVFLGTLGKGSGRKIGELLWASGIPVVEFRTSWVIGPGSPAFETIHALVEPFPVLVTPRWVATMIQPIALEDVIAFLLEAIQYRGPSRVFEIGGSHQVSLGSLLKEYARQRRLRRWFIAAPRWVSRLSDLWLRWMHPAHDRLRFPMVVSHEEARRVFQVRPCGYDEAITRALNRFARC